MTALQLAWACAAVLPALVAAQPAIDVQARSERHSDFSTLAGLDADQFPAFTPRSGRNLALLDEAVRIRWRDGAWRFGAVARNRAVLVTTGESIEALQHVGGRLRGAADQAWTVQARLRGFRGVGLEVEREFTPQAGWHATLSVQGLALTALRDRHVDGALAYRGATGDYAFALGSSQADSGLRFPFQTDVPHRGFGLLLGGTLERRFAALTLGLAIRDLGVLSWRGLPQQDFTLASNTRTIDANGFVVYQPLLQGQNRQSARAIAAPAITTVQATWQATRSGAARLAAEHVPGFGFLPQVGWSQHAAGWTLGANYKTHERRLTGTAQWGGLSVEAGADRLGGTGRSRVLALRYALGF